MATARPPLPNPFQDRGSKTLERKAMTKASESAPSRRIPANSLLAVQFDRFKIRPAKKEALKDEGV